MAKAWRLSVPSSSANLGPGFDTLGLALSPALLCEFTLAAATSISVTGRDAALIPASGENLVWSTANEVARRQGRSLPHLKLDMRNEIPLGKGMGSSAAALTAGVVLASVALELDWDKQKVFAEAARLEGHPDNVAACVFGSLVASAMDEDGQAWAVRLPVPPNLAATVVSPNFAVATSKARSVLPLSYSRADFAFNLQRCALLVAALAAGRLDVLPDALADRLHQPYRAELVPGLLDILALRGDGLFGCCLSGAGPSVLVLHQEGTLHWPHHVAGLFERHGQAVEVHRARIDTAGYTLEEGQ